jgi:hypothetical protein
MWILSRISVYRAEKLKKMKNLSEISIQCLASGLFFLQTPIYRGEENDLWGDIKGLVSSLLGSQIFFFVVLIIGIVISLMFFYNRKKSIPELEAEVIQEDTWFTTRDDNNRVSIVVSVKLRNRSTKGIRIVDCKLSGYSARGYPPDILLEGTENEEGIENKQKLNFPGHRHFYRDEAFYLGPYSSENLWFYYESRVVTMRNLLEAPLKIKDSEKRRKSLRVRIPRHADQLAIYREMAKIW